MTDMTIVASDIVYDCEDHEESNLPTTFTMVVYNADMYSDDDLAELISDEITNVTGFCHFGFTFDKGDVK